MVLACVLALAAAGWGGVVHAQDATTPAPPPTGPSTPATGATPGPAAGNTPAANTPANTPAADLPPRVRSLRVDAAGGPLTLADDVRAAVERWSQAAPGALRVTIADDAPDVVRYGDPSLLGPDTLSLALRRQGGSGVEIELAPDATRRAPTVLLHVVGVVLGLPEAPSGVMARAVPGEGAPDAPTDADVAALRALQSYAPEDLNRDGVVDFYDLVRFGQAFGDQGVNLPADFDGNGRVDDADLELLRAAYRFTPPAETAPGGGAADAPAATGGPAGGGATPSPPSAPTESGAPSGGSGAPPGEGSAPPAGGTSN